MPQNQAEAVEEEDWPKHQDEAVVVAVGVEGGKSQSLCLRLEVAVDFLVSGRERTSLKYGAIFRHWPALPFWII
jgi:hypothetical protein